MQVVRILVVEDDARMRELVRRGLVEEGHAVETAASTPSALEHARSTHYDVMIVDVMLPGASGLELVRALRHGGNPTPVLVLTARDAAADVVAGLDAGADDYLTKPFALKVLLARIRALGRRAPMTHGVALHVADLVLDEPTHTVRRGGAVVVLTRTEYNLLESLMRQAGRVVTRDRLMTTLWGSDRDVGRNTLDTFIKSLRQKVDSDDRPLIHTVWGVGYCLRDEPEP
jgi:DNA-binding response OmpR family regulator